MDREVIQDFIAYCADRPVAPDIQGIDRTVWNSFGNHEGER
jgi:hypothetical protein